MERDNRKMWNLFKIIFVQCKKIKRGSMEYGLSLRLVSYNHRITIDSYVKLIRR